MLTHSNCEEYRYINDEADHTQAYLWPPVLKQLEKLSAPKSSGMRILDLGCGNGAFAGELSRRGYTVVGVEPSESGIQFARSKWPSLEFHVGSAYDDLASKIGLFDVVVSLEVVEHVYSPKSYAASIRNVLAPHGVAILSTPFHGYWKNLILAASGKMDAHFTVLWEHGHIKFWSPKTLSKLLVESGFDIVGFEYAGRFPPFSKSMIAIAKKSIV